MVKNAPEEIYYLDLLVNYDSKHQYNDLRKKAYDEGILKLLEQYSEGGWYPALAHGTITPIYGNLVGEKQEDYVVHKFQYVGVPNTYRIIIVTPDHQIRVSNVYHRRAFQQTVILDYETLVLSVKSRWMDYLKQFVSTFFPTIFIEGIVLLLFGFSLKKNWRAFLLVNLATQIAMTGILGTIAIKEGIWGVFWANFSYLAIIEIVIMVIEANLYCRYFKDRTDSRRKVYSTVANLMSYIISVIIMLNLDFWSI
jgi:hypothetical protein